MTSGALPIAGSAAASDSLRLPGLAALPVRAVFLGQVEYEAALALQRRLVEALGRGEGTEWLLLCEHPDVITVGRRLSAPANILSARFPVVEVERGGDVTYHGPGQLVGYPILRLRPAPAEPGAATVDRGFGERDLHRYLRALEAALIDLCAACGVAAGRREGATGVWTAEPSGREEQRKLASLGIAVRRWVSFHGFALNVTTELERFAAINPCGFAATVMTSLAALGARLADEPVSVPGLLETAVACLSARLNRTFTLVPLSESNLEVSAHASRTV